MLQITFQSYLPFERIKQNYCDVFSKSSIIDRGYYMCGNVLLNGLGKSDKMRGLPRKCFVRNNFTVIKMVNDC